MTHPKLGFELKIFHKMLLTMVAIALIPLASLMYLSGYKLEQDWRHNVELHLTLTASNLAGKVNGWIDTNLRVLRENTALPEMISMNAFKQQPILKAIQSAYDWSYLVFTVDPAGQNIARSAADPPHHYQYGDRDYFKEVLGGKPVGQQVVIGKTSQKPALILAGPIRSAGGTLEGVMALALSLIHI